MNEIDSMDFLGFLHIRAWAIRKEKEPKMRFIDQVWPKPGDKLPVRVR